MQRENNNDVKNEKNIKTNRTEFKSISQFDSFKYLNINIKLLVIKIINIKYEI